MAEKKTVETEEPRKINPWKEDFVNVYIPKRGAADEDTQFVDVNGHTFLVKKEVDVAVPRPVAEVLKQRNIAIKVSDRAIERAQEAFNRMP